MIRRTLRILGGGGDHHGMPTTKEAAHLVMNWVLSRPVPPSPGKGKRYASFTYPGKTTKYQFNIPEQHEVRAVSLVGERDKHEVSSRTRMSDRSIAAVVSGWKASILPSTLSSRHPEGREEPVQDSSSVIVKKKTPHSVRSIEKLMVYDVNECNDYLHRRGGDLAHRLKDYNPKGHEREHFPWQPKPKPPPSPPPKK